MKIKLVHCPEKPTGMAEGAWYIPLNLVSIATYLRGKGIDAEILDGQLMTEEEIAKKISADIVGFDLMHSSIESFDYLSKIAKLEGAITIAGGHLATHLAQEILNENKYIDYVCRLGGEDALLSLCRGSSHPNLAYRKSRREIHVPSWQDLISVDLERMPIPDRSVPGVEIEKYIQSFQNDIARLPLLLPYDRATNTYFCRGCPYRKLGRGCSFCSRSDTELSKRNVKQIWTEGKYLAEKFDIECIVDFSDTFVSIIRPLAKYVKENGRPWKFLRVYAAVNEIVHPDIIPMLKVLGVVTVLLGIESADESVLRHNVASQKIHTPRMALKICQDFANAGIMVSPAYVLGMKGESKRSIHNTLEFNQKLQALGNTEITYSNIITPFPGTRAFDDMVNVSENKKKYRGTYHLPVTDMEKSYIDYFTTVGWDYLQDARLQLAKDSRIYSFEFTSSNQHNL